MKIPTTLIGPRRKKQIIIRGLKKTAKHMRTKPPVQRQMWLGLKRGPWIGHPKLTKHQGPQVGQLPRLVLRKQPWLRKLLKRVGGLTKKNALQTKMQIQPKQLRLRPVGPRVTAQPKIMRKTLVIPKKTQTLQRTIRPTHMGLPLTRPIPKHKLRRGQTGMYAPPTRHDMRPPLALKPTHSPLLIA